MARSLLNLMRYADARQELKQIIRLLYRGRRLPWKSFFFDLNAIDYVRLFKLIDTETYKSDPWPLCVEISPTGLKQTPFGWRIGTRLPKGVSLPHIKGFSIFLSSKERLQNVPLDSPIVVLSAVLRKGDWVNMQVVDSRQVASCRL